jgi:PTH1 family peptidyl-tRNA hydrolase
MFLIVGLGNPGEKYQNNRHNVGFMFADYLSRQLHLSLKDDKYIQAEAAKSRLNDKDVVVAKPQTFMNRSGEAVNKIMKNLKIDVSSMIVVHDDLDIPLGKFKIQKGTGPELHKGIESIEKIVKSSDFWRIRIGVDNRPPQNRIPGEAYVLQNFTSQEKETVVKIFPQINNRLTALLNEM